MFRPSQTTFVTQRQDDRPVQPVKVSSFQEIRELLPQHVCFATQTVQHVTLWPEVSSRDPRPI